MSIQPLPPDVIAQIKSSAAIISLNGTVVELVKNALDAGASTIDITVDYGHGGCVVEDNGLGIPPSDFKEGGCLGKFYHSSKLKSQTPIHGGSGTFIASLSALSFIVVISRHYLHRSYNALSLHKSEVILRQTPCPAQLRLPHEHGTRIIVRDLFGNMPVRVKQRAVVSETQQGTNKLWKAVCKEVVALLLAWPTSVSVTARQTDSTNRLVVKGCNTSKLTDQRDRIVTRTCHILAQAFYITPDELSSWVAVSARTQQLMLSGTISLQPAATRNVQFLALGVKPILAPDGQNMLYDEINRLFTNSAFGIEHGLGGPAKPDTRRETKDGPRRIGGYTMQELKGSGKGIDRWPMFYINIQRPGSPIGRDLDEMLECQSDMLRALTQLLQAMIHEFLTRHHFRPGNAKHIHPQTELHFVSKEKAPEVKDFQRVICRVNSTALKEIAESKLSEAKRLTIDLAADVKLPSFQRPSTNSQTSFDSWCRIKSGSKTPKLADSSKTSNPGLKTGGRASAPLVSTSGKLIREPFTAVGNGRSCSVPPPTSSFMENLKQRDSNSLISWINPVTKVRSLIDSHTGHVIPSRRDPNATLSTRLTSSRKITSPRLTSPSPWVDSMLKSWENPIFKPTEMPIPQVPLHGPDTTSQKILQGRHQNYSQTDIARALGGVSANVNNRISKISLSNAEVISQVDRKFILVKVNTTSSQPMQADKNLLVIIDQHAADERIRVESLMTDLCNAPRKEIGFSSGNIMTQHLDNPLAFEISKFETQLLEKYARYFANWGIIFKTSGSTSATDLSRRGLQQLLVTSLPPLIAERCRQDPKILLSLLRKEVHIQEERTDTCRHVDRQNAEEQQHWLHRIRDCPQSLLDMINSRACRSAIMFNDELSQIQCQNLVHNLAECVFPFQCAHGRPSLVPLVDLQILGADVSKHRSVDINAQSPGLGHRLKAYVAQGRET